VVVSDAEDVRDNDCASGEALAEVEYSIFEGVRIVSILDFARYVA
jgi:hypothetical protein